MVSQGGETRVFAVSKLSNQAPILAACSGAVLTVSLGANFLSDVTIETCELFFLFVCFVWGQMRFPGETFEGKVPCCYYCRHKKKEPFSPWKQNDNVFHLCSLPQ